MGLVEEEGMRYVFLSALPCAVLLALPSRGEAGDTVLREDQVTEAAIVEALKPPPTEDAGPSGVRTRGFKPAMGGTGTGATAAPRAASVLITFATDSAELTPSARATLDIIARALQSEQLANAAFRIEGHADPTGSEVHNLELSRRRADSVVAYLTQQRGLQGSRLEAMGKGSGELLNKRVPQAAENRRVTFVMRSGG
jgi:outer membrane protein OmpA-like peptidoglycan-associated protein